MPSLGDVLLTLLMFVGLFLMFVILLQRGRGGGLAGAFGGLGGQSAFGTKAGDVFTVITIVTVVIWVILACLTGWRLRIEANPGYGVAEQDEVVKEKAEEVDGGAKADKGRDQKGADDADDDMRLPEQEPSTGKSSQGKPASKGSAVVDSDAGPTGEKNSSKSKIDD